ncbi:hypothetical protein BDW62DRAFT_178711 [Aspergillus aurantiobrunneus]
MLIARQLERSDLNALLQIHSILYHQLNDYLYHCNVQYDDSTAMFWAARSGSEKTIQRLLNASGCLLEIRLLDSRTNKGPESTAFQKASRGPTRASNVGCSE